MATKSYQLRLDLRLRERIVDSERFQSRAEEIASTRKWLDDTREAFNAGVDYLTGWLLRMHRGAGVWREKRDGIWREWQEITTLDALNDARSRRNADPANFALIENRELLDTFRSIGKSEAEAVELAECCRCIAKELCPPNEDSSSAQMPRGDLDLLTLTTSTAKGIRDRGLSKAGTPKQKGGRRPRWMLKQAIADTAPSATSWSDFETQVSNTPAFRSASTDGKKLLKELQRKYPEEWCDVQSQLCQYGNGWEADKRKAEERQKESAKSGCIAAYRRLLEHACLPLPGFRRPNELLRIGGGSAEWNYAMWNMAGQRVRSHLGCVRRRAKERLLWEFRVKLFDEGGWVRTKRNGKQIRRDQLKPDDFCFKDLPEDDKRDFKQFPAYGKAKWVVTLREYEQKDMIDHLGGVAFGAAEQPRIRKRTAKGWPKIRDKWIALIKRAEENGKAMPSAEGLLDAFDQMRNRKPHDFGGRRLFEWLADPDRRWLWDGKDHGENNDCARTTNRDCVSAFIDHNELLAKPPKSITWTKVDPVKHPVWPFFGENSAVKYWMARERLPDKGARLILVLKQLFARQEDGSYSAVDRVKIALRGYEDFERSFTFPEDANEVSPKQELVFHDDLIGGQKWKGRLSALKLIWERSELEAHNRKLNATRAVPRIFASFSCEAGKEVKIEQGKEVLLTTLPDWLTNDVGYLDTKHARDGVTGLFWLDSGIRLDDSEKTKTPRSPGAWMWPRAAIENGFTVRGTDLGYRISSAGAYWRLSFDKPNDKVAWEVGTCDGQPVYAVLERTSQVLLPGDGEMLPQQEIDLRERLRSLRDRLKLNNSLLRIVRLLTLETISQCTPDGDKVRRRSDGTSKRIGTKWRTEQRPLEQEEIKENCRKASALLVNWASTDAMTESLKLIGFDGKVWDWLAAKNSDLEELCTKVPSTKVPTEKEAKEKKINRDDVKRTREAEDMEFTDAVYRLRTLLAKVLCDGYDAKQRRRATAGLWYEFDTALVREVSYGDRRRPRNKRIRERVERSHAPQIFDHGLLRLLRRPPVTKHGDRKDDVNNLPHGLTYRGGLSMSRLKFLDDVKNFVRRWSCRPRWSGDVRRVPRDAKVNRGDTEHLDNLREHRAKLIAHADVAQTLGFEQDFRRGIWRYRDESGQLLWHRPERGHWYREEKGRLVQCQPSVTVDDDQARHPHPAYPPAHVLVYENLTRYKMSSDRPKNENAGLARWSHRRILAFAQHIGGLFGVPVATVDARFSSRYCSHCGAPGYRADRFDPAWLKQAWLKRVRIDLKDRSIVNSKLRQIADQIEARLKQDPKAYDSADLRPWVLRDGGSFFVCANRNCHVHTNPISADENAAANVGLRFLRGMDGVRVEVTDGGTIIRSIGYVALNMGLVKCDTSDGTYWIANNTDSAKRASKKRRQDSSTQPELDTDDDDEAGGTLMLFRDPSGQFRPKDRWYDAKDFWSCVVRACASGIDATDASSSGPTEDD